MENLANSGRSNGVEKHLELDHFNKVRAHRVYQYAMSRYKLLRYDPDNVKDKRMNW
jgi:hypothetical protein